MKKAQIEMMGLVIVVILVTIGLFFSVALQDPVPTKRTIDVYGDEELAGNLLITLLESNVEGTNIAVHDLALDCVRYNVTEGVGDVYDVDGKNSCQAFNDTVEYILNETLEKWGHEYEFVFRYETGSDTQNLTHFETDNCYGERAAPGVQPISLFRVAPGTAYLQLDLCMGI